MSACLVCSADAQVVTVTRDALPSMQNYVHRTKDGARAAARGRFSLAACECCGFAWNATFDPSKLEYDAGYDNAVPSAVMDRHYNDIAVMLGRTHALSRGYVVDIGCGNGTFLKTLCSIWPECRALGVDPALPRSEALAEGRLKLIKGVFAADQLEGTPSLLVSRHVLEHMSSPVSFVREVREVMGSLQGVPLYVEVPDLDWILEHQAFWDFCYEHCNYFSPSALGSVLSRAGFSPTASGVVFGRQYRWMEAVSAPGMTTPKESGETLVSRLREYVEGEASRVREVRHRLRQLRDDGRTVAVWGMATKGIMFSLMVDPDSTLIDCTVDVNVNKQGCYVPISGRRIDAPTVLQRIGSRSAVVVVMNTNYLDEIAGMCRGLGLVCSFLDASGSELVTA